MTKLKEKKHSNCDKAQKLKLWQNLKFEIATNSTEIVKKKKNKNSNCDKTYIMTKLQTHKFKYQQNLKTQIWNKLKNINCDKTKKSNSYYWISKEKNFNCFLLRTTWHLNNRWDVLCAAFWYLALFF